MTSVLIQIDSQSVEAARRYINSLSGGQRLNLMSAAGALIESQTRERLAEDKSSSDGTSWQEWSDDYAATRGGGQSLLESEGNLVDSIAWQADDEKIEVGTELVYGALHQRGLDSQNIPARPFLGLSMENENDLVDIINGMFDQSQ